jgi:flagellin
LEDLDRFWDANGNFILDNPQPITLVQGDGGRTSVTIFRSDTIFGLQQKLNEAIGKGLSQGLLPGVGTDYTNFVQYVTHKKAEEAKGEGFTSVFGTFVIQSAITGKAGEIYFVGNDPIIDALSLTTIQKSTENNFTIDVFDAHDPTKVIAQNVKINGNNLIGIVHPNVDVQFHNNTGVSAKWNETLSKWDWIGDAEKSSTFVHLADNTSVFHIGANPLQDVSAAIGNMGAAALGVNNILVTSRDLANIAMSKIDGAISRVSGERAKMGALQNRLEHTINNLSVAAENLSASESRIRDLDMAREMMEFTKNQILMQAGTAMLAQANMKPQMVLQLLG